MKITIDGNEFEAPSWAKWVAQDKNGEWYAYDMKPTPIESRWDMNPESENCILINMKAKDWKNSLEMIKKEV